MNKKVRGKLDLSRETVCKLDELTEVKGGIFTHTNACSDCTACASCTPTCMIDSGVCAPSCNIC